LRHRGCLQRRFHRRSGHAATGDNLVWSPTNSRSALLDLINGATTSLLIAQEEMDDAGLSRRWKRRWPRRSRHAGAGELKGEYSASSTPQERWRQHRDLQLRTGYYIHAKVILADYGPRRPHCYWLGELLHGFSERQRELA